MKPGHYNVGLKMTAEDVADGIAEREAYDTDPETNRRYSVRYGALDPAAFAEDGGPSIAERMARRHVYFQRADNKRVARVGVMGGWDQLRARLVGVDDEPMIYFFSTCEHTIRTLPALQHDSGRPEDVDTEGEDHAGNSVRYGVMSRPWLPARKIERRPTENEFIAGPDGKIRSTMTIRELIDRNSRRKREVA